MSDYRMFVDHWEEFNQRRLDFRNLMKEVITKAYNEGKSNGYFGGDCETGEIYAEEKLKELF